MPHHDVTRINYKQNDWESVDDSGVTVRAQHYAKSNLAREISYRNMPGAAARHPTDHPKARFRTPAYLPDRPERLAPCRGHAPDVTLRRP